MPIVACWNLLRHVGYMVLTNAIHDHDLSDKIYLVELYSLRIALVVGVYTRPTVFKRGSGVIDLKVSPCFCTSQAMCMNTQQ